MKAVVLAYHTMGCVGIEALIRNGFEIPAVFTHPDDPEEDLWFRPVAELAAWLSIPVYKPEDINEAPWVDTVRSSEPEIIFSFYYRRLIRRPILDYPRAGCLNLHGSLLPAYRGRCPVNWVLLNGEKETGVSLHYMTPRPDDGDIVDQEKIPISEDDTALTLYGKMIPAATTLLDRALPLILRGVAPRRPQDHSKASYFGGRRSDDGLIDWGRDAGQIRNLVRAVTRPYPGAFSFLDGRKFLIWAATVVRAAGVTPGTIISIDPLVVACGHDALQVDSLEAVGAGSLPAFRVGARFQ